MNSAIIGICLFQLEQIFIVQNLSAIDKNIDQITQNVNQSINNTAWYIYYPLNIYLIFINLLCIIRYQKSLHILTPKKRKIFLNFIQYFPFYTSIHKLINSLVFLNFFDYYSIKDIQNENCYYP